MNWSFLEYFPLFLLLKKHKKHVELQFKFQKDYSILN